MDKTRLSKYAKLIAQVGANVQKGQDVVVYASLEQPEFVELLVEECYKLGARRVYVEFSHQPLSKLNNKYAALEVLSTLDSWEVEKLHHQEKTLPAKIYLESDDPDGLKGIDQEKQSKAIRQRMKIIKPIRDRMESKYQWCIAAVPGLKWAEKVFDSLKGEEAVQALWERILDASRVYDDPINEWKMHNEKTKKRCDYLNSLNLSALRFCSSNGTDLTVGLIEGSLFLGGGETTLGGVYFNPNIPTEEIFISPKKGVAQGIVYSSKPLIYQGQVIDEFYIRFNKGKAVEVNAKVNQELLEKLISMDEGAAFLGECALVPYDSPIRNSEILFYNTLFDENAACHLAVGAGFIMSLEGFEKLSIGECYEKGINNSIIHQDFMIGTSDMSIIGIKKDSSNVEIFKHGNFVF